MARIFYSMAAKAVGMPFAFELWSNTCDTNTNWSCLLRTKPTNFSSTPMEMTRAVENVRLLRIPGIKVSLYRRQARSVQVDWPTD